MIFSSWFCFIKTHIRSYSQGISILMLILNIFDIGSTIDSTSKSQGTQHNRKGNDQPSFCSDNLEHLFAYTYFRRNLAKNLSSNHRPSSRKNFSSTTTAILPQGNKYAARYFEISRSNSQVNRIDSYQRQNIPPISGCIDLNSYSWSSNNTSHDNAASRLSDVQIFLFHVNHVEKPIDFDLRILLYSTQESALNRPVVVVLSSFLPRKFSLSVISFLSHSHQPLHIILTHPKSEVIIKDELFNDADLKKLDRLFISIVNLSNDRVFVEKSSGNDFIAQVERQFKLTTMYNNGYFYGSNGSFLSEKNVTRKLWLFDNEAQYSKHKPNMRIVAIYQFNNEGNFIDLVLGKTLNQSQIQELGCQRKNALIDIVRSYQKWEFTINREKTCFYDIKGSLSEKTIKYQTITWLHIKTVNNISLDVDFISSHRKNYHSNNETYLMIITGNDIVNSLIKFSNIFSKNIKVLTNISLNQFEHIDWSSSSIFLQYIADSDIGSFQYKVIANYISLGSKAVMETTAYQFKTHSDKIYRIRVNIDDSYPIPQILNVNVMTYSPNNASIFINLKNWNKHKMWTPTALYYGDRICFTDRQNEAMAEKSEFSTQCTVPVENRKLINLMLNRRNNYPMYGVWKNNRILLDAKTVSSKPPKTRTIQGLTTTRLSSDDFIPKIKDGFSLYNKSDFKFTLQKPLFDKMVLYMLITNDINGDITLNNKIQLRDCYITNRMAKISDFQSTNKVGNRLMKVQLVREGCIYNSSHWYSNIPISRRPNNESMSENLMYRFSIVVDADYWAKELSLENQWRYNDQFEVHLYCGISKCEATPNNLSKLPSCRNQTTQCSQHKLSDEPLMKYYGVLLIVKKYEHVTLKISILVVFSVLIILLISIIIFWCVQSMKQNRHNQLLNVDKCSELGKTADPEASFSNPRKKLTQPDYHSLTLIDNKSQKSSVKIYSEPHLIMSLKRFVETCDKSIFLHAGYLNSNSTNLPQLCPPVSQHVPINKKLRIQPHSASETSLNESTLSNWVINSWPLSTAERKSKFEDRKKPHRIKIYRDRCQFAEPSNCWHQNTNSSAGSSSKQKISYTFNSELKSVSNAKAASNRTTVSESISANEMPSKTSSKWWSLLTNYWMNQNFAMSRN